MSDFKINSDGVLTRYTGKQDHVFIPIGVKSIGSRAFWGCKSLKSIEVPSAVTSIGENAFMGCSSLTSIVIPEGVTSIERYAFSGCKSLTNIVIPEGVISIEDYAFIGCTSLTSIVIPESVTSIGMQTSFTPCIVSEEPDRIREMITNHNVSVLSYNEYLGTRYADIGLENLSQKEAKELYELIETRKIESEDITRQEICSIFHGRKIDEMKRIMGHVGLDLDMFTLGENVEMSISTGEEEGRVVEEFTDLLENHLPLNKLNMFRQVVGNMSFTLAPNFKGSSI